MPYLLYIDDHTPSKNLAVKVTLGDDCSRWDIDMSKEYPMFKELWDECSPAGVSKGAYESLRKNLEYFKDKYYHSQKELEYMKGVINTLKEMNVERHTIDEWVNIYNKMR